MSFNKIVGWLLLFFGLFIIIFTLYQSYNVFTGSASVPEVFKEKPSALSLSNKAISQNKKLENVGEKIIREQLKEMIPVETIPKFLNFVIYSIMVGIFIFGGSQIATLGIKLIKK